MSPLHRAAPLASSATSCFAALLLCGCPGSIGFQVLAKTPPKTEFTHAPNAKDLASWIDAPQAQLESHPHFAPLPRETRSVDDGSEVWSLRSCPPESKDRAECCVYEFVLRNAVIASYRPTGVCMVSCKMRPEPKIQACIDDTNVPEHYGAGSR
jgi:hypothetical protein